MIKKKKNFIFLVVILNSCSGNDKLTLVESSGRINHILIVIKNSDWKGDVGDALRDIITTPLVGLPQEEYQFSINQISPQTFNSLFKRNRNIMFVGYDSIANFYSNSNIYAAPQTTLTILGKNKEDLIKNINSHKNDLISTFKNNDLKVYQKKITSEHHNLKEIETFNKLGFTLKLPFSTVAIINSSISTKKEALPKVFFSMKVATIMRMIGNKYQYFFHNDFGTAGLWVSITYPIF